MHTRTGILFSAVFFMTMLTAQTKNLHHSEPIEREETCTKILADECPGSRDVIPFAYPPESKGIDDVCSAASTYFPCFKSYASTCNTKEEESLYFLTYLQICDSSYPMYNAIRKSIGCLKLAEKRYNETCIRPNEKLEVELTAFGKKINSFGISDEDWKKIAFGLVVLQQKLCYIQIADECPAEFVETVDILHDLFGARKVFAFLLEKQSVVEKVLDNLNLEEKQKLKLKQNIG